MIDASFFSDEALATSPRNFAAEISSWVLQHKQQHTELDSFIQALLLYLSTYGSVVAQRQQLYVPGQTHQATGMETVVMGMAPATSLTEELLLLDSGTSVAAQSETTDDITQVAMETTTSWKMEDEAERAKHESA